MNRRTASRADTRLIPKSALFALIGLILSPLAVAHAATSPSDRVHFCAPFDYEQWRRDHPRPAGKALEALDAGEPRTVRMIYFLPNDRPYQAEVVQKMKDKIPRIQTFYAEQMQAHGHGNTTFRIETDAQGEPRVHRVDGRHPNSHYLQHSTSNEVLDEIDQVFDIEANVYLIVIDSRDSILSRGRAVGGVGSRASKIGGFALVDGEVPFDAAAHELGHAFGLKHDFRDDTYIMSYGSYGGSNSQRVRISACNADFLAVHTFFNPNSPATNKGLRPTSQLISPHLYPPGSANIPIRLKVGASKGLHQAILLGTTGEPHFAAGFSEVQECSGFAGQKEAVARFEYDGIVSSSFFSSFSDLVVHRLGVDVVDADGNLAYRGFKLAERSPYLVATLEGAAEAPSDEFSYPSVAFSPDGTLLAFGSGDVRLWNAATRQQVATFTEFGDGNYPATKFGDAVSQVAFSPDGTLLAFQVTRRTSESREITWCELWNVANRQRVDILQGGLGPMSFSPDGTLLAIGEENVELWDVASRKRIATFTGHVDAVSSMSFSPDGTLLAIGEENVELWDVASRKRIATLTGHQNWAFTMSFSPDGTLLASGSQDNTVGLWDVAKVAVAQTPHRLTKVSGDGQQGPANTQLAKPFVVSVLDQDGSPVAGVRVAFFNFSTTGGALLSPASHADPCAVGFFASSSASYTNANGQASARLTLGSLRVHSVFATVEGLEPVTFAATKSGQANPHRLTKVCGDSQEGIVDEQLAEPFVVSVSDENGAAIAGVAVSFAVTAGEGTLSSATDTTDANGRAATYLTLGSEAGTNTVAATVEGLRSATFTATGERSGLASMFDAFGSGKPTALPDRTQLLQNAPNPFNSQTVLSYFLLEPSLTRLEVFALTGQRVAVLHQGPQQAGYHRLHWDGRDAAGHSVASGAYLYRLVTDEVVLTRKLILLR